MVFYQGRNSQAQPQRIDDTIPVHHQPVMKWYIAIKGNLAICLDSCNVLDRHIVRDQDVKYFDTIAIAGSKYEDCLQARFMILEMC
jgi:hypothetical protein